MKTIVDGNYAAVYVAYRVTDFNAIYPITPSTTMGELAAEWSSKNVPNLWGHVPRVVEMQSEGGAAGALHGALQGGLLATTFTASQGLLLMIPDMYRIAGELTPAVIHVASRALATQALSIFGDHSDVYAARDTGFAILAAGSVQEAHDFALLAHAATLQARIPFMHFFDGFRTSHEINKIDVIPEEIMRAMIDEDLVLAHRQRALNPDNPFIRGTAHDYDVSFQVREIVTPFYASVPKIVQSYQQRFAKLTGRNYGLVNYYGAVDAERVIIIMGSAAKTAANVVDYLRQNNEKVGVLQIILYRPFPMREFLAALPKTVQKIAVLDRSKNSAALGEPLYQDVLTLLGEAYNQGQLPFINGMPKVYGGRYGLSSKDFTPAMAKGVFDELHKTNPKNHFTVGIIDDVSLSSIDYEKNLVIEGVVVLETTNLEGASDISSLTLDVNPNCELTDLNYNISKSEKPAQRSQQSMQLSCEGYTAIFFGLGADGTVSANKNTIKIIGEGTDLYVQAYFVYDSKKSGSRTTSYLRFGNKPIAAPYLIQGANFIACHQFNFIWKQDILGKIVVGGIFLLNSPYSRDEVWEKLPRPVQQIIVERKLKFYVIDALAVAKETGMGTRINTIMQTCFFDISGVLPQEEAIRQIKQFLAKSYKHKGHDIIQKNFAAVDQALQHLYQVKVPNQISQAALDLPMPVSSKAPKFVREVTAVMMAGNGNDLPVSAFPVDGTYPSGTTQWEKRNIAAAASEWNSDLCVQCGACSLICPHAVIRAKHFSAAALQGAPKDFKTAKCKSKNYLDEQMRLQIYIEDCTACGLCQKVCPAKSKDNPEIKAIMVTDKTARLEAEKANVDFFADLPYNDRQSLDFGVTRDIQYLQPLFEFSGACAGCGETPYIKLLTQLFGDHMLVANATGCTSIYGGNLPTTPWASNADGRGPAWSNSLFEDNAEFGLGFKLSAEILQEQALQLLDKFTTVVGTELAAAIKAGVDLDSEKELSEQRQRVAELKEKLKIWIPRAAPRDDMGEVLDPALKQRDDMGEVLDPALKQRDDTGVVLDPALKQRDDTGVVLDPALKQRDDTGVVLDPALKRRDYGTTLGPAAIARVDDRGALSPAGLVSMDAKRLQLLADYLVKRSVWLIGGDGWSYDIGYGGLDHVLASGHKVKVLVLDTEVYSNTGGQSSKATPLGAVAKFAEAGKSTPRKDLGALMRVYENIYVAQIAIGADPSQTIRALREAESYQGPSIIIAYSHCINHGYDLARGLAQQKLAVASGFWPLYRYNPERVKQNLNPFQLDSKAPTIKVAEYAYNEPRFKFLLETDPKRAEMLMQELQKNVDRKWKELEAISVKN